MSSWVLHCGSQHKTPGQSNTDFDLNLNQTLEFPDETKCTIFNVNVPNTIPNVCDAFGNNTWQFVFRMYAINGALTRQNGAAPVQPWHAYHNYDVVNQIKTALLHSEYTLRVRIPDGSYQHGDMDNNFTENVIIPERIGNIFTQTTPAVPGNAGAINAINDNAVANTVFYNSFQQGGHRFATSTGYRNRTYYEALQDSIRRALQAARFECLNGGDGGATGQVVWTDPSPGPLTAQELADNELYKLRILKFIVSEMDIDIHLNANHQPSFAVRTDITGCTATNNNCTFVQAYLANQTFLNHGGIASSLPFTGLTSGALTTSIQVNPWMQTGADQTGHPTHFIQCKIIPPAKVRYATKCVSTSLDYFHNQYIRGMNTFNAIADTMVFGADSHITNVVSPVATSQALATGNFSPYGKTWSIQPTSANRSDSYSPFIVNDGTDGWFACVYWGVRQNISYTSANTVAYSYLPVVDGNNVRLVYVNDVCSNHISSSSLGTAAAPQITYGTLTTSPANGLIANGEYASNVYRGITAIASAAQLITPATSYNGAKCLTRIFYDIPTMDYESTPTFVIEFEMFGTGNHMKFIGSGDCKRVKLTKRMVLNLATYGGFIRACEDAQQSIDYGTCLGLSKVSNIKCRVLNENGEVIRLTNLDSFPPWTFSLAFEC